MDKELQSKKIAKQDIPDILRWGYSIKGTFNIKEVYCLKMEDNQNYYNSLWKKIWTCQLWLKISYLLWFVCHHYVSYVVDKMKIWSTS